MSRRGGDAAAAPFADILMGHHIQSRRTDDTQLDAGGRVYERGAHHLRPDTARIAEGHGETHWGHVSVVRRGAQDRGAA
jgi:hypothetical protein